MAEMVKPKLLVFASGGPGPKDGGSGFEKLVEASRRGCLKADIVGVVSNHEHGGVRERADRLGIRFIFFKGPYTAEAYQAIAEQSGADFFALSGWLKMVKGLNPNTRFNSKTVFNIHPGLLPNFGGPGMYGHHVHEAVMADFHQGEIEETELNMHFVTEGHKPEDYDRGPVFLKVRIRIRVDDTPETLGKRVNRLEHLYQWSVTDLVVNGLIRWDGVDPKSLVVPPNYAIERVTS